MKLKENWTLILLGFSTLVLISLGAIIILRPAFLTSKPEAPSIQTGINQDQETSPTPKEEIKEIAKQPEVFESEPVTSCQLSFNIPSVSPTPTPTPTLTPTPTPTQTPECWEACETNDDCPSNLTCQFIETEDKNLCVNNDCPQESDCVCPQPSDTPTPTSSPTPTPTLTNSPTPTPTLPPGVTSTPTPEGPTPTPITLEQAGMALPTLGAAGGGLLLIFTSLLLLLL